jgi:hypothetical protein
VADASLKSKSWVSFDSVSIGEVRFLDGFGNLLCCHIRDGFIPTQNLTATKQAGKLARNLVYLPRISMPRIERPTRFSRR